MKDKISADEVEEPNPWLEDNQTAEKEEFDHQKKELESVCTPIITKKGDAEAKDATAKDDQQKERIQAKVKRIKDQMWI